MSEIFDPFDCELSPSEELQCIDDAIKFTEQLFGSIENATNKDYRERSYRDGRLARISRLVIPDQLENSYMIDCAIFLPQSPLIKGVGEACFTGYCTEFNIDTKDNKICVQRGPSKHRINRFGDSEIEPLEIDESYEANSECMRLSDRSYFRSMWDIL